MFQKYTRAEKYEVLTEDERKLLLEQKRISYEQAKNAAVRDSRNS